MTANENEFAPVTPGEMLREEFLAEYGLSQSQLAKALGISPNRIAEIVAKGDRCGERPRRSHRWRACRFDGIGAEKALAHASGRAVAKRALDLGTGSSRAAYEPPAARGCAHRGMRPSGSCALCRLDAANGPSLAPTKAAAGTGMHDAVLPNATGECWTPPSCINRLRPAH
jgi:Helix-turn-helix